MSDGLAKSTARVRKQVVLGGEMQGPTEDLLAAEVPLEIRLEYWREGQWVERSLAMTMRTPGAEAAMVVGFLMGEGILQKREDLLEVQAVESCERGDVVRVRLAQSCVFDFSQLERHFVASSSCGVCGKEGLSALVPESVHPLEFLEMCVSAKRLHTLPGCMQAAQSTFQSTGGLHAAALFDVSGELLGLHEDVGRHNAVDKVLGEHWLNEQDLGNVPRLLVVSSRTSFEILQKAAAARIPLLAAVGAPSSLAVEMAMHYRITLVGFLGAERFNVYSEPWRIGC